MITEDAQLMIWRALHDFNGTLNWIVFLLSFPVIILLYRRLRAGFLICFLAGNTILLLSSVPNEIYPQGDGRPVPIGTIIETMRVLWLALLVVGCVMSIPWFMKTRDTQPSSGGDSSTRADAGFEPPQK